MIVNDNGSADNSRAIMDRYGGRITACYQENKGPMGSYNSGFAASSGEIICILDSDDYIFPGKISRVVDVFRTYPDIGWFFRRAAPGSAASARQEPGVRSRRNTIDFQHNQDNDQKCILASKKLAVFTQVFEQDICSGARLGSQI